jgi:hypothetical protein
MLTKIVGKMTVEKEWLEKKLKSLGLSDKKQLIEPKLDSLSLTYCPQIIVPFESYALFQFLQSLLEQSGML